MKTEVIRILEKRAEHFEKIHHSYEAREVRSAIDTIKRLIPPELFAIHGVVLQSEQLPDENLYQPCEGCTTSCKSWEVFFCKKLVG
jgi:hypothetical protein